MTRVRLLSGALALLVIPALLSAPDGGTSAATEAPEPSPPTTVPATSLPVEPGNVPGAGEATTGGDGDASAPPAEWPKVGGQGCTTPWGVEEPAWCDPRVYTWIREDGTCHVTPAGVAAGRVCPTRGTTTVVVTLPRTK